MSSVEFTDNSDEVNAAMRSAVLRGRHNSVSGTFPRGIRRRFRDCPHTALRDGAPVKYIRQLLPENGKARSLLQDFGREIQKRQTSHPILVCRLAW